MPKLKPDTIVPTPEEDIAILYRLVRKRVEPAA